PPAPAPPRLVAGPSPAGGGPEVRTLVLVDAAAWAIWGVLTGFAASRLPDRALDHDTGLTRIRPWERRGRAYERVGIRRWKDRLPDAGKAFGGRSKRHLGGASGAGLARFEAETRRAELVHWANLAFAPVFALWNPAALAAVMATYAV